MNPGAFANAMRRLGGWRRALVAIVLGAICALAMPPYGVLPALMLGMTGAVWLIDGTDQPFAALTRARAIRAAAGIGWCFGFGFFVAGLWWLGAAFLVDNEEFAWALPLGVLGLPAGLSLFIALAFALARALWSRGPERILTFTGAIALADYARGHVLTGFPWNLFGMALGDQLQLSQIASVVGLYGLSVLATAIAASFATLGDTGSASRRFSAPLLGLALLAGLAGFGMWRLSAAAVTDVPGVRLRLMQPNLAQDSRRFSYAHRDEIMRRYLALTDGPNGALSSGETAITHVIWPESSFPFLLAQNPTALAQLGALLPPGATLITGAARGEARLPGEAVNRFFNSMQVVNDQGRITSVYDKVHLVPFGEYLPLAGLLQRWGLRQFVHVPGGFTAGERQEPLSVPGLPQVAPLICYEAIFPGEVVPPSEQRPGLLLNVTNDAWFGDTPGPHQHFAQSKLRAIEEGLPLVRAANTGISAVVDPYGRMVAYLPLGKEGIVDAPLPSAIPPTPYAHLRDIFFAILVICCFIGKPVARMRSVS